MSRITGFTSGFSKRGVEYGEFGGTDSEISAVDVRGQISRRFHGRGHQYRIRAARFRGPDGVWTRQEKGLPPISRPFTSVEPNAGHRAIGELQNLGKLKFLISQNVDNLHLRSGIRPELLAELHGNVAKLKCQRCQTQVEKPLGIDTCKCGGKLVSSVVNFGDSLPQKDLEDSFRHSSYSDLFIVVGSSLVVSPANDMPRVALRSGARLVIINQGETPMDRSCHLRFDEKIGEVLPPAVSKLKS